MVVAILVSIPFALGKFRRFLHLDYAHNYFTVLMTGYSDEHDGLYPALSTEPGRLMFADVEWFERNVLDESVLSAWTYPGDLQSSDDPLNDHSYFYLGYAVSDESEAQAFADAYKRRIDAGEDFASDLVVSEGQGNFGSDKLYRLRTRLLAHIRDDLQIDIGESEAHRFRETCPVFIQRPRGRDRIIVFNLNGSLQSLEYPGSFPASAEFMAILEELDRLGEVQ